MLFICVLLINTNINAQIVQSSQAIKDTVYKLLTIQTKVDKAASIKSFFIPAMMIGYGVTSLENHSLLSINDEFKEEVFTETKQRKTKVDNYLQYAPAVGVYALNLAGIKGKHNFVDRSGIYLISNIILTVAVQGTKKWSHELRPDGSAYNSFPSGHTAEAFASAEFLRLEYKDVSPWYGVAGYAMAAATGYMRMTNNRHWFSDIVGGAGVGIASTKIAWWLYPKVKQLFHAKDMNTFVMPTYQDKTVGLSLVKRF